MIDRMWDLVARLMRAAEAGALRTRVRTLRAAGQTIAEDASFGPRVQLDLAPGARLRIGARTQVLQDSWLIADADAVLDIGSDVFISQHVTISGTVTIGDDTLIAGYVTILDANHVIDDAHRPIRLQGGRTQPIRIGRDVWIGTGVVVLPGVTIGDHAVIGANSTVTHDVPAWAIAVGSPARVLRLRTGAPAASGDGVTQ